MMQGWIHGKILHDRQGPDGEHNNKKYCLLQRYIEGINDFTSK
jgi:hypothetical protein